jgi:hypothetical protein
MTVEFTAIIKKEDNWWLGWVEEVPGLTDKKKPKKN